MVKLEASHCSCAPRFWVALEPVIAVRYEGSLQSRFPICPCLGHWIGSDWNFHLRRKRTAIKDAI